MKTSFCRIKYNTIVHAKETIPFAFNSRSFGLLIGEGVLEMMERSHSGFRDSTGMFLAGLLGGGERSRVKGEHDSRDDYLE